VLPETRRVRRFCFSWNSWVLGVTNGTRRKGSHHFFVSATETGLEFVWSIKNTVLFAFRSPQPQRIKAQFSKGSNLLLSLTGTTLFATFCWFWLDFVTENFVSSDVLKVLPHGVESVPKVGCRFPRNLRNWNVNLSFLPLGDILVDGIRDHRVFKNEN